MINGRLHELRGGVPCVAIYAGRRQRFRADEHGAGRHLRAGRGQNDHKVRCFRFPDRYWRFAFRIAAGAGHGERLDEKKVIGAGLH